MHGKLAQEREEDVVAEYVGMRAGSRERMERAGMRDKEEEGSSEDTAYGGLNISKFDSIQVHDTEDVGSCKAVEAKDLKHLESGYEGAPALTDDVNSGFD